LYDFLTKTQIGKNDECTVQLLALKVIFREKLRILGAFKVPHFAQIYEKIKKKNSFFPKK